MASNRNRKGMGMGIECGMGRETRREGARRRGGRVALRVWGRRLGFDRSDDAGRIDTEEVKVAKPRCHVDIGCVSTLHGARRRSLALALPMLTPHI